MLRHLLWKGPPGKLEPELLGNILYPADDRIALECYWGLGTVSGRAASVRRSTEVHPFFVLIKLFIKKNN